MGSIRSVVVVTSVGAALSLGTAASAWATTQLRWHSPRTVVSGQPFQVSSIDPCPALPHAGDRLFVQISVTFPAGGGLNNGFAGNADGSWSGQITLGFSNAPRRGDITAFCEDYNGVSATTYAQYESRKVQLIG